MAGRIAAITLFAFAIAPAVQGGCVSSYYDGNTAATIGVQAGTFPNDATVAAALAPWNGCPSAGTGFPRLSTGSGEITVTIDFVDDFNPDGTGCGVFRHRLETGSDGTVRVVGGTIVIYHFTRQGYDCSTNYQETISHELGHVLGLDNAAMSCTGYMMGPAATRYRPDGTIEVYPSRSVRSMECYGANKQWLHGNETSPPEPSIEVPLDEQGGACWDCTRESPIVIQLAEGPFRLSGPADAVRFDIDADGTADRITWIGRSGEQALLARDLNDNGIIDDGSELFGTATRLLSGTIAEHGFEALIEADANHDRVIDDGDAIWYDLLLWFDTDHDGVSDPAELIQADNSRLREISLRYRTINRRDQHGNWYRYHTIATLMDDLGQMVRRSIYDIFFVKTATD